MLREIVAALLLAAPVAAQTPKPNIVLILADDLDALLGTTDYTTRINRLLRDGGISFDRAYVTNSVCCPSRATLLRGQYTHSHRTYTNQPPWGGHEKFRAIGDDTSTIAVWLQRAGYATALMGKYLNGYPGRAAAYVPPGWTDWRAGASGSAYGNFNYRLNENGTLRSYGRSATDYMTDVLRDHANRFIRKHASARRPFFLAVATYAPHGPATPAPRHDTLFAGVRVPRTPSFAATAARTRELDRRYRLSVQSMQAVDELVASLIETLRETGTLDHTYLFFTSDNGFHMGQHGLNAGKQTAYEEDIRVPLFVRGPGIRAGRRSDALVANVDFAPTFAAIAGIAAPVFVEGRSLLPLFMGPPPRDWRTAVLIESYAGNGSDLRPRRARVRVGEAVPRYIALRTADHTYVEFRDGARQLFDNRTDPHQLRDLATDRPELVRALSDMVTRLARCQGPGCRAVDRQR